MKQILAIAFGILLLGSVGVQAKDTAWLANKDAENIIVKGNIIDVSTDERGVTTLNVIYKNRYYHCTSELVRGEYFWVLCYYDPV